MARDFSGGGANAGNIEIGAFFSGSAAMDGIRRLGAGFAGLAGKVKIAGAALGVLAAVELKKSMDAAQRFEDNLVRIRKVAGSDFGDPIARSIRNMSRELPVASQQLFDVAESAVRLGISGREDLTGFVRTMAMVGQVTDMSALDASEAFARIAAVMDIPISQVDKLAAAANEMSDRMATSFSEVINSAGELAPVMSQMGIAPQRILAIAAAQNEVNISVRRGAQRLRSFTQQLEETGRAANIAEALDMTAEGFTNLVRGSPEEALLLVANRMQQGGEAAVGLREAFDSAGRLGVQGLSQNLDSLTTAMRIADRQFEEGTSLIRQFGEQLGSATSKQEKMRNEIEATRSEIGENLLPLKKGWVDFWGVVASAVGQANRHMDEFSDMLDKIPRKLAESTQDVLAELEARRRGFESLSDIADPGHLAMIRNTATARMETARFADTVDQLAATLETTEEKGRLLNTWYTAILPMIESGNVGFDEAIGLLGQYSTAIKIGSEAWKEFMSGLDEDDDGGGGGPPGELVERLKGMDLQFATKQLANIGVALGDVDDSTAQLLLNMIQSQIEFREGAMAAREFELQLQGVDERFRDMIVGSESYIQKQEEITSIMDELVARNRNATLTEREMFEQRLNNVERLLPFERQLLMAMHDSAVAAENRKENEEEVTAILGDLRAQVDELTKSEWELLIAQLAGADATDEEIEAARHLFEQRERLLDQMERGKEAEKEAERRQDRIRRIIEGVDLSNIDNRFRMLDRGISSMADTAIDMFKSLGDESKNFADVLLDSVRQIAREMAKLWIQHQIWKAAMKSDSFRNFIGLAGVAGSGGGSGMGGASTVNNDLLGTSASIPTTSPSGMVGSMASDNVEVNVSYNINAIDSKSVEKMLKEQGGVIAEQTAEAFHKSSALKRRAFS